MTDIYTALSWAALFWQISSQISTLHCIGRPGDIIRTEIFTALTIAIIQISLPCPAQVYTVQVHTAYISIADIYNTAQKQQTSFWQIFENASTSANNCSNLCPLCQPLCHGCLNIISQYHLWPVSWTTPKRGPGHIYQKIVDLSHQLTLYVCLSVELNLVDILYCVS